MTRTQKNPRRIEGGQIATQMPEYFNEDLAWLDWSLALRHLRLALDRDNLWRMEEAWSRLEDASARSLTFL